MLLWRLFHQPKGVRDVAYTPDAFLSVWYVSKPSNNHPWHKKIL